MLFLSRLWRSRAEASEENLSSSVHEPSLATQKDDLVTTQGPRGSDEKSSFKGEPVETSLVHEADQTSPGQLTLEEGQHWQ